MSIKKELGIWMLVILLLHICVMLVLQETLLFGINDPVILHWARVSSGLSIFISLGMIFLGMILLVTIPFFAINLVADIKINYVSFSHVIKGLFVTYICFEIVKLIYTLTYIRAEVYKCTDKIKFIEELESSSIQTALLYLDAIYILIIPIIGGAIYFFKANKSIIDSFLVGCIILVIYVLLNIPSLSKFIALI